MDPPKVGGKAPGFSLPGVLCGTFDLEKEVRKGPVLLYFYVMNHGRTCTDYIAALDERTEAFDSMGVRMVHINPDTLENHRQWMDRTGTGFEHLSDRGQAVSRMYGAIVERARNDSLIGHTNRCLFLVDADMVIRYAWRAFWPTDTVPAGELVRSLNDALGR